MKYETQKIILRDLELVLNETIIFTHNKDKGGIVKIEFKNEKGELVFIVLEFLPYQIKEKHIVYCEVINEAVLLQWKMDKRYKKIV